MQAASPFGQGSGFMWGTSYRMEHTKVARVLPSNSSSHSQFLMEDTPSPGHQNEYAGFDPNDFEVSWFDLLNSFTVARHKIKSKVLKKSEGVSKSMKRRSSRIRKLAKEHGFENDAIKGLAKKLDTQLTKLDQKLSATLVLSRTEKLWYTASLVGIAGTSAIMVAKPEILHIVYTVVLAVLLPIRFFTYFKQQFNYYLADLCYFVTFIDLLYIWVWPESEELWIACYAFSFGSLAFAIIAWRNSLVLHSIDKTTSTAIHFFPPLVFHCIKHSIPESVRNSRFPAVGHAQTWHMLTSVTITTAVYFIWQSLYHFFITWKCKDKIAAGQVTSFEFLRKAYKDTRLGKFVNNLPGPLPVLAFTMIQFSFQLATMLFCPIWYQYQRASEAFLMLLFICAAYNGATYYIDVFGQRFHKEVMKLQQEIDSLTDEADDGEGEGESTSTSSS